MLLLQPLFYYASPLPFLVGYSTILVGVWHTLRNPCLFLDLFMQISPPNFRADAKSDTHFYTHTIHHPSLDQI